MNTAEGIFLIKVVNKKAQRIKVSLGLEVDDQVEVLTIHCNKTMFYLVKQMRKLRTAMI